MKRVYPIILTPADTGYVVYVPTLDINTEGKDVTDAIEMARDAIGLWGITKQDMGQEIPKAGELNPAHKDDEIVATVDIDFDIYRRRNDNRAVKKTLTIPSWLNAKAEAQGINFSQELQERLKEKLGVG